MKFIQLREQTGSVSLNWPALPAYFFEHHNGWFVCLFIGSEWD
jgi:hypothetical protein